MRARNKFLSIFLSIVLVFAFCPGALLAAKAVAPQEACAANQTRVMYRLYNPNSGEHFYTASKVERNGVVAAGWKYEGTGWTAPVSSRTPVYRLYSGTDHHYTMSADERDMLKKAGWKYEGIGWYSDDAKGMPLYRQFNPYVDPSASTNNSGSHNYTTSMTEHKHLVSLGWKGEGVGWYGVKASASSASASSKPAASSKPSSAGKPSSSSKPGTTTKPSSSSKPSIASKPSSSSKPSGSNSPGISNEDGTIVYDNGVKVLSSKEAWGFEKPAYAGKKYSAYVADASKLKVGDIVVIAPDTARGDYFGGTMRITEIDTSVNPNVIRGEEPAFEDVFKSVNIDTQTTGAVTQSKEKSSTGLYAQESESLGNGWTWTFGETSPNSGTFGFSLHYEYEDAESEADAKNATFDVSGSITPSADISVSYDEKSFSHISIENTSTAQVSISGEANYDRTFQLGHITLPTPVEGLALDANLYMMISAHGEAEISAELVCNTGFNASTSGVEPLFSSSVNFDGNASINFGVNLMPSLAADLFGLPLAGVSVSVGPHIGAEVRTGDDGPPIVCADGSIWAEASVYLGEHNAVWPNEGWTALGTFAHVLGYELPNFYLLQDDDDNFTRHEFPHFEDGAPVSRCTRWDKYAREPSWTEPSYVYNRLAAPFVIEEGKSFSIGASDGVTGVVGGLGTSLDYQVPSYDYELSRDCVLRVTLYDENDNVAGRYLEGAVRGRVKGAEFTPGSCTNKTLIRRDFSQRTVYEVLKGEVLIKSILTNQVPTNAMGEAEETYETYADALEAFEKLPEISN